MASDPTENGGICLRIQARISEKIMSVKKAMNVNFTPWGPFTNMD